MTFRTLAAPAALAALLFGLWGCAGKTASTEPGAQTPQASGNAAFEQKDYARACQELTQSGGGADGLSRGGLACVKDGEAKAERAYKAALSADERNASALEGLGLLAYGAGDLGRSRDMLEAAAKAGGRNPQAALVLGQAYLLTGQCAPALAALQEALRRDPNLAVAKARLDVARFLCGSSKGATGGAVAPAAPPAGNPGAAGGLSGQTPAPGAAGGKDAPKGKPTPKTIDLNDI